MLLFASLGRLNLRSKAEPAALLGVLSYLSSLLRRDDIILIPLDLSDEVVLTPTLLSTSPDDFFYLKAKFLLSP